MCVVATTICLLFQEALVWSVRLALHPKEFVVSGLGEGLVGQRSFRIAQSHAPGAAEDLDVVGRVVSHEVESGVRIRQPVGDGGCLPRVDEGVQVTGYQMGHLKKIVQDVENITLLFGLVLHHIMNSLLCIAFRSDTCTPPQLMLQ